MGVYNPACGNVFVYDRPTRSNLCVAREPLIRGHASAAEDLAMSADGRHVAYVAYNPRKVTPRGDEEGGCERVGPAIGGTHCFDVFVHDLDSDRTVVASVGPNLLELFDSRPTISGDGRFVLFAGHLRDRDTDGNGIFEEAGKTAITQIASGGRNHAISADGRYIAYEDGASVIVRDLNTAKETVIHAANEPSISSDGQVVAFTRPEESTTAVYVYDLKTGKETLVSVREPDAPREFAASATSEHAAISGDGRFVAFVSGMRLTAAASAAFCSRPNTIWSQIYLRDLREKTTTMISASPGGLCGDSSSESVALSGDGRFAAFISHARNLTNPDDPKSFSVFVWRRGARD